MNVGEGLRGCFLKEIKPAAADDRVPEVSYQLIMVQLAYPQKIEDVLIEVVQNFSLGEIFPEEDLRASAEWLYVRLMFWEKLNESGGETIFAAYVRKWADHSG